MVIPKKISYFFYLICILANIVKNLGNNIVNYKNYTIKHNDQCKKQQYVYFLKKMYKLCYLWYDMDDSYQKILVQTIKNDKWEIKSELIYNKETTNYLYYSYVINEKLIVVNCFSNSRLQKYECIRSVSNDGIHFENMSTSFSMIPHDISSINDYSSQPFYFKEKNYLLICSLNGNISWDKKPKLFITCTASSDNGVNWGTIFRFYYVSPDFNYNRLKPVINGRSIGFHFTKYKNNIWARDYIECNYNTDFDFECNPIDLQKDKKNLQAVLKIDNNYVSSYMGKDDFLCYLYYTSENIILIKTEIKRNKRGDCNPRDLIMLDNLKFVLIYADGMNIDGFSKYYCINN
ncbi:secreted ookinete protein, putative [Plasmodium relictum]|uniref:Secreted ookinete protein, putative n=1 Tax=Plasmodium relictum TaxID=85471 RepID=A0A1J1H6J2_PLARL|nr:secreted ookinete protein, putative [Plasmodium relictum]CRH00529.1 secreted ookinete protein, putative [Plasmodium relictum]